MEAREGAGKLWRSLQVEPVHLGDAHEGAEQWAYRYVLWTRRWLRVWGLEFCWTGRIWHILRFAVYSLYRDLT